MWGNQLYRLENANSLFKTHMYVSEVVTCSSCSKHYSVRGGSEKYCKVCTGGDRLFVRSVKPDVSESL